MRCSKFNATLLLQCCFNNVLHLPPFAPHCWALRPQCRAVASMVGYAHIPAIASIRPYALRYGATWYHTTHNSAKRRIALREHWPTSAARIAGNAGSVKYYLFGRILYLRNLSKLLMFLLCNVRTFGRVSQKRPNLASMWPPSHIDRKTCVTIHMCYVVMFATLAHHSHKKNITPPLLCSCYVVMFASKKT